MIVAIVGPTGVGKTKMSIELAKSLDAIIINCDAVQVYKELNIGSAKATVEEQGGIPHYLLNIKKNVSIIEENILNIKIEEYLEEIFLEKYRSNDQKFLKLISDFCIIVSDYFFDM